MNKPANDNSYSVQRDHGGSKDAHTQDVRSWRDDGRNNKNQENGVAEVLQHKTRADDAHQCQEKNENRHLEDQAHAEYDAEEKRRVFGDGDHGRELPAEMNQKTKGSG